MVGYGTGDAMHEMTLEIARLGGVNAELLAALTGLRAQRDSSMRKAIKDSIAGRTIESDAEAYATAWQAADAAIAKAEAPLSATSEIAEPKVWLNGVPIPDAEIGGKYNLERPAAGACHGSDHWFSIAPMPAGGTVQCACGAIPLTVRPSQSEAPQ